MDNIYRKQLEKAISQVIDDEFERYEYCQFVKRRKEEAQIVCLYGTGNFYSNYARHIDRYDYVCDSNSDKWGKIFDGRKCISIQQLSELKSVVVFVMLGNYREVVERLNEMGIESYFFGDLYLNVYDKHYSASWFQKNKREMLETIDVFADDYSKNIYTNVICNRIAPQYAYRTFHEMEEKGEYFATGIFPLGENECYVDVGAYNGDSIVAFMDAVKGKFEHIYGFEIDSQNFYAMTKNKEIMEDKRIQIFHKGISCEIKQASIVCNDSGSHVEEKGNSNIELDCLDNLLENKKVTFIKMDIEGAERDGMVGARRILSTQHPKLAISVYHKLDDMWKIPNYIREICPSYKIYLRHHTAVAWDTDCYAIVE